MGGDRQLLLLFLAFRVVGFAHLSISLCTYVSIIIMRRLQQLSTQMKTLSNRLRNFKLDVNRLPSDIKVESVVNDTPRKVTEFHYCRTQPQPRTSPHVAALSNKMLQELDLNPQALLEDEETPLFLSGAKLLPNSEPICNNYCGHQFGNWAGQLGDGRAQTLGFYTNTENQLYELQLKGSGKTPFSRFADGNSVTSSALREYLASEAMQALGVPTTRAASLIIFQDRVRRDPFYDGHITMEKGAIVLRVCPSFLRFGSFQICNSGAQCYSKDKLRNKETLRPLADFLIQNHYKHLKASQQDPYQSMFLQIIQRSARMVAKWQSIGFVHGVLNTDNMSMLGVTIDYGPFSFIDYFSKDFVSNMTDKEERYSYRRQPAVVKWNLRRLAEALDWLVPQDTLKKHVDQVYMSTYEEEYYRLMHQKLGIKDGQQSRSLIDDLFNIMDKYNTSFTNTFRLLGGETRDANSLAISLSKESARTELVLRHLRSFPQIIGIDTNQILEQDEGYNSDFITSQPQRVAKQKRLSKVSQEEYLTEQVSTWKQWLQRYLGQTIDKSQQEAVNPKYVLRNDVASNILAELNKLDDKQQPLFMEKILSVFEHPYQHNQWFEETFWNKKCDPVKLTCSS